VGGYLNVRLDLLCQPGARPAGSLGAVQGQPERAARLIGAAAVFHETSHTRAIPLTEALFAEGIELAREALGEGAFARAWAAGGVMSSEEAIAEALAVEIAPGAPPVARPQRHPAGLTDAEVEVLRRLASGLKTRMPWLGSRASPTTATP